MPSGSNSTEGSKSIESEVKETGEETDEAKVWLGGIGEETDEAKAMFGMGFDKLGWDGTAGLGLDVLG